MPYSYTGISFWCTLEALTVAQLATRVEDVSLSLHDCDAHIPVKKWRAKKMISNMLLHLSTLS
jgi:hypothetical protein